MAATQTLLSNQLQLSTQIRSINIKQITELDDEQKITINENSTVCICGDMMRKQQVSALSKQRIFCKICGFLYTQETHAAEYMYCCDKNDTFIYHPYNICITCVQNTKDFNHNINNLVKDIYDTQSLYFIYNNNSIHGPYSTDDIINAYIRKQIKCGEMWIKSAFTNDNKWHKLTIPRKWNDYTQFRFDNQSRRTLIEHYKFQNKDIKHMFPELYENLIENVIRNRINQIILPTDIPMDAKKESKITLITQTFGKCLAIMMALIIVLHCMISILIVGACCCTCFGLLILCGKMNRDDIVKKHSLMYLIFVTSLLGLAISPIVLIHFILSYSERWMEIQSWMIAYIVWGIFTFMVLTTYTILTIILQGRKQKKYLRTVNRIIFFIVAIDFGAFDIISMLSAKNVYIEDIFSGQAMGLVTFFLQMPIASLLPSAVCGFIANYILQEKFELKCRTEIVNTNICFNSLEYGCCEVISSHNWMNSYAFMGRFASNILAVWAIIRICGYLLANARSDYAIHAKRTK
eukprot:423020_1